MKIILMYENHLSFINLPETIEGSFWINNPKKHDEKMINIEARDNAWWLVGNEENWIITAHGYITETPMKTFDFYSFGNEKEKYILYTTDSYDKTMTIYEINRDVSLMIGSNYTNSICYDIPYISTQFAQLVYQNKKWMIALSDNTYVYINNRKAVHKKWSLKNGDNIFIMGLSITVAGNKLIVNNPQGAVKINIPEAMTIMLGKSDYEYENVNEVDLYNEDDYFFKTPRLRRFISTYDIKIAPPPQAQKAEELPLILMLGPMLTMGMTSAVSLFNIVLRLSNGQATLANSWTTLVVAIAMMCATLVWPNLTKQYRKKMMEEKEQLRREKYSDYLDEKKNLLAQETVTQTQILNENLLELKECYDIIKNRRRVLWERKSNQQDFLTVRVGIGDVPLDANIQFSEDEFILEEDDVKEQAKALVDAFKILKGAPVGYSFYNKKVTAAMGIETKLNPFIDNVVMQLVTFHSYDDLKIVVFTSEDHVEEWEYIKKLPHCFSNDKSIRFFSSNEDDEKKISYYLEQEFIKRIQQQVAMEEKVENEDKDQEETYLPYYLILTDDFLSIRKLGITEKILKIKENYGFGFFIKENRLGKLPSECETFITLSPGDESTILSTELDNSYQQNYKDEVTDVYNMDECAEILANIPIEFEFDYRNLPTALGFLEMYGVGKIEQLNTFNRWRLNDPTKSLRAVIGVDDLSNKIYLDLHEKAHGPHGLIAGTTGSGKSEFIITYILSLCLNFSPNEVAFILIDYKGGGLAGAFENKKNNVRLPHLAGTITNLDKNELNRTLVSIDSELKRRQKMFNDARDELGESTMDIYKYQKFFRAKKISEPIPHLFIICDEFAELKSQQPDFMDNLISAARIGRSLGVHLILATQKPSGVVNDQIWSNTKFRVCLKVANQADSSEMLKKPDAANITNPGRFYLQVGNDEIYLLAQSGYAGTPYIPKNMAVKEVDRSLAFIDNIGDVMKTIEVENNKSQVESKGDELSNVLKYITAIAIRENVRAKRLWLDNIPPVIYIKDLAQKYRFTANPNRVVAIVGEYDDPSSQHQDLLTLELNEEGNTLIYGLSGTGREQFIKSIIYSCSMMYTTNDINFYIFDFGSESLRVFSKFPHVGDIVFSNESEKLDKLFKIIDNEINYRKELFADYNGDYSTYCKGSGKKIPIWTVIINNFDSFKESYGNYEELITKISREGKRYGILTILANASSSGIFTRLARNFSNTFVLNMNDKNDYVNILGKIGNVYPSDCEGRGLFKKEIAYEFQTASIVEPEQLIDHIKEVAQIKQRVNTYVPKKVPILPEAITLDMILHDKMSLRSLPIGIERESLNIYNYNFKQENATIISANEAEQCIPFVNNILKTFRSIGNVFTIMIDGEEVLSPIRDKANEYFDDNYSKVFDDIIAFIDNNIVAQNRELVILFSGLDMIKMNCTTNDLNKIMDKLKTTPNAICLFIDAAFKLKKYVFESWYSGIVSNSNGIWVGSGVADQSAIKVPDMNKKYREQISDEYVWIFKSGKTSLVKIVNSEGDVRNEEQNIG